MLHAFAVKAAPLVPVLRLLYTQGIGVEVASPGELGARPSRRRTPPTAPSSTPPPRPPTELREALALGIAVNADNPQELDRIDSLVPLRGEPRPRSACGSIRRSAAGPSARCRTATPTSKFGVALRDEGARAWVVRAYLDRPWLTRLHTHTGSQGVPLALMAEGVRAVYDLAEEINAAAGRRQVDTLDIGGGLPVNFASDEETPTYAAYAALLRQTVPGLFDGRYGLVTEFGRSLLAKHGTVLARVEYTKSAGGRPIAVTHAGAQVATRTVYAPDSWPLRIARVRREGPPKTGPEVAQDVAGPACFAGDMLAVDRPLPLLEQGDLVAALDTGAYYFSNHYAYNSLARPGVHGFTTETGRPAQRCASRPYGRRRRSRRSSRSRAARRPTPCCTADAHARPAHPGPAAGSAPAAATEAAATAPRPARHGVTGPGAGRPVPLDLLADGPPCPRPVRTYPQEHVVPALPTAQPGRLEPQPDARARQQRAARRGQRERAAHGHDEAAQQPPAVREAPVACGHRAVLQEVELARTRGRVRPRRVSAPAYERDNGGAHQEQRRPREDPDPASGEPGDQDSDTGGDHSQPPERDRTRPYDHCHPRQRLLPTASHDPPPPCPVRHSTCRMGGQINRAV